MLTSQYSINLNVHPRTVLSSDNCLGDAVSTANDSAGSHRDHATGIWNEVHDVCSLNITCKDEVVHFLSQWEHFGDTLIGDLTR